MALTGGSATLYGVLYQLLGSLHHTVRLLRIQQRKTDKTVLGARITVEPLGGGGDIRIEVPGQRTVEQWKARTNGRPWGLQEILDTVIPDLYRDPALDLPEDQTRYVFAAEGSIGPKATAFFQSLRGPVPEKSPLAGLKEDARKSFRATAKAVQQQSESLDLAQRKLRRLLSRFELRGNQDAGQLIRDIDRRLLALVDYKEDIPAKRDELCTIILRRGTGTGNEFMPEDLLKEAGLHGVSLEDEEKLRRRAHQVLSQEVERRKYHSDKDVRETPAWPEGKRFLFLSGESGQGKTWQVASLAVNREEKGRIVVIADSRGDAERDLQRASDLLWKEAWDHDQQLSLDRLAERWLQVRGDAGQPWLTLCIENVQSLSEARALVSDYHWEKWGVELALSGSSQIGDVLEKENPNRVHHVKLRDFKPAELRDYLQRHGRSWETVRADVRETLKRPLLAGLYTSLGSGPDFAPTQEYELYEGSWEKAERDLSQDPEDLYLLKQLALTLFDEEPHYPWTLDQLRDAGIDKQTRERLERIGWWIRNAENEIEVWHDRMLSWAIAEAIAGKKTLEEIGQWLRMNRRPQNPRIRRILGYVTMDVLWLLSGNPSKNRFIPDVLIALEQNERPSGYSRLYQAALLPTLGWRIVPGLVERLRRLPERARYSYQSLATEVLSQILKREPEERRAELAALLPDPSSIVRKVAVKVLARHPHASAIDRLWNLLREKSLQIETSNGREGMEGRQSAFAALRSCLELNPGWLRSKIQESRSEEEPVGELAYLLANLKHPEARTLWKDLKKNLFEKVRPGKRDSLIVCIRMFQDREEVSRLEEWLLLEEKWTDNSALNGIARIDPDRAILLLETMPLDILLNSDRGWLPILLLKRPDGTRRALRKRLASAGADFWRLVYRYGWYETQMDRETVETMLDRLAVEITESPQDAQEIWDRLQRSLDALNSIHRVDLLEAFQARAGTDLDRNLGELGSTSINASHRDLDELHSVLLKIGGEGIRRLIQSGLASSDSDRRSQAMAWGMACPEELATTSPDKDWVLAVLGPDRTLVERIIVWEKEEIENEHLTMLWRLRRWRLPMPDNDLAPALEALGGTDPQKWIRGLAAISISERTDLLSQLPGWMEQWGGLDQEHLEELDERVAYLVHRLAKGNPESVRQLATSLDVRRFSQAAARLLYESRSEELADRIETELLERLQTQGRLRIAEINLGLRLDQDRRITEPLLREIWKNREIFLQRLWRYERFFPTVSRLNIEEVEEKIWEEAFGSKDPVYRISAIRALHSLEPDEAIRAARRGLEDVETNDRPAFVSLLFELGGSEAIPWLIEQTVQEKKAEVLWAIARGLRQAGPEVEAQLRTKLASSDFRVRSMTAHLAGWQGPGFLELALQRMAEVDPDDDVQRECRQALSRQHRERCVLELMDAFRHAPGVARWSYLESILELGDPHLLVTEEDPLWLGRILTPELGPLEVHANELLKKRFEEIQKAAEQRDKREES